MNKVAVVTGTSSGIGKAITEVLLQNGYKVYGISRESGEVSSPNFVWIKADLLDLSVYDLILKEIQEERIDLLINNAGIVIKQNGFEFTEMAFETTFGTNFKAPVLLTKALKNKLDKGLVINISSVSDRLVGEEYGLYCASKAALNKYFETTALEEKSIRFISILPSYVDTPLLRKLQEGREFNWDEIVKPQEVAELVEKIIKGEVEVSSGAKIVVVSEALTEDLKYDEDLYGYNTTTKSLTKL